MNLNLLERLVRAHGTAGEEAPIRALLTELAAGYADEVRTDPMGNLIVHKKGSGKKILLAAHMDVVGVMATHYEKEGVVRFTQVGGLDPATLLQTPVRFKNGVWGLISCDDNKLGKELKIKDLFLDIGAKDEQEARHLVKPGDTAIYYAPVFTQRSRVISPYLDNRAGCLVLLNTLKRLSSCPNDIYFVFTVQEEVGTRGAGPAAYGIEPDYALVVDVTCPDDIPGALHEGTTALGKGAAVKVMDRSLISAPELVQKLNSIAREQGIQVQQDVMSGGGTDGGPMQRSGGGVPTGGVSIPCRYTHAPTELIDWNDLEECVRLVTAFCESEFE